MSKQFHVYLLPSDVEVLIERLQSQLEIAVVQSFSPGLFPVYIDSPILTNACQLKNGSARIDCYLAPSKEAEIKMKFVPIQSHWSVEIESEVIEFRGCEYDGAVLVRGRFYFQNDLLANGMLMPKRTEFLTWADNLYRIVKKSLHRSKSLDAYIGEEAEKWRQSGGKFAWTVNSSRGPIYESEI